MKVIAPGAVDALHGSHGSAAVMAGGLSRGGQYRMDAMGAPGMGLESMQMLTGNIENQLYGNRAAIADMKGIGMGALGQIFDESSRRGYLPGSIGAAGRATQNKMLAGGDQKLLADLEKMSNEDIGPKLRQFDASRVTSRLKELAGSVSAMKEIFGSQGQPDAPMSQLLNALESITQNRLGSMPAAQVEQTVRMTKSLMDNTGMGLDAMMGLTSRSAAFGDKLGLSRGLAIHAGQTAAAMGAGYKNAFGSFGAYDAMSAEEVTAREVVLATRAGGSEQAQFAGAAMRTVQAMGLGGRAKALSEALASGATEFEGKSMYQVLRSENLSDIIRESGGAGGVAALRSAMSDTFGNQEFIAAHNLGGIARKSQAVELEEKVGRPAGELGPGRRVAGEGLRQQRDPAEPQRQARR